MGTQETSAAKSESGGGKPGPPGDLSNDIMLRGLPKRVVRNIMQQAHWHGAIRSPDRNAAGALRWWIMRAWSILNQGKDTSRWRKGKKGRKR